MGARPETGANRAKVTAVSHSGGPALLRILVLMSAVIAAKSLEGCSSVRTSQAPPTPAPATVQRGPLKSRLRPRSHETPFSTQTRTHSCPRDTRGGRAWSPGGLATQHLPGRRRSQRPELQAQIVNLN